MDLATAISWVSVSLLIGAGAISMDNDRGRIMDGFRRSLDLLAEGQCVKDGFGRRQDLERACAELREGTLGLYRVLGASSKSV
jgi:hypothetical protein